MKPAGNAFNNEDNLKDDTDRASSTIIN